MNNNCPRVFAPCDQCSGKCSKADVERINANIAAEKRAMRRDEIAAGLGLGLVLTAVIALAAWLPHEIVAANQRQIAAYEVQ